LIESFWFRSNDSDHVSDIHKDTFTKRPVYLQPQIPHIRVFLFFFFFFSFFLSFQKKK